MLYDYTVGKIKITVVVGNDAPRERGRERERERERERPLKGCIVSFVQ